VSAAANPSPNVGPIGPEPAGATPIVEEDLEGLIPDFVATRADLNQVEFESIARSLPRLLALARSDGPEAVLDYGFLMDLHRRMFADVWRSSPPSKAASTDRSSPSSGAGPADAMAAELRVQRPARSAPRAHRRQAHTPVRECPRNVFLA
jgi:hypothetical protein